MTEVLQVGYKVMPHYPLDTYRKAFAENFSKCHHQRFKQKFQVVFVEPVIPCLKP